MIEEQTYLKTVLRFINSNNIEDYLTPCQAREELGYPRDCCMDSQDMGQSSKIIGIGFRNNLVPRKDERFNIVLSNSDYETIFCRTYEDRQEVRNTIQRLLVGATLVGYDMASMLRNLGLKHNRFIDLVHLCPHGLGLPNKVKFQALAMQVLNIKLPIFTQNVRGRRHYRHYNDPLQGLLPEDEEEYYRGRIVRQDDEERQYLQTLISHTVATIKIAQKHIANGSGVVTTLTAKKRNFNSITDIGQILQEAEIERKQVCGLYLRGSRALGIQINSQQYLSDWDYICILQTKAVINSILLKLHNIDIILLDKRTADILLNGNDIPMVELFYLPQSCILVNQMTRPFVDLGSLKKSLIYHLGKVDEKVQYYSQEFFQEHMHPTLNYCERQPLRNKNKQVPNEHQRNGRRNEGFWRKVQRRRGGGRRDNREERQIIQHPLLAKVFSTVNKSKNTNPNFLKWKFMKAMHLQVRFLDEYLQFKEFNCIRDIRRTVQFWKELCQICTQKGFYQGYRVCSEYIFKLLNLVFSDYELKWCKFKFYKVKQIINMYNDRYHHRDAYFYGRRRRMPSACFQPLSIYRCTTVQSNSNYASRYRFEDQKVIQRFDDINDDHEQFFFLDQRGSQYKPLCIVLKESLRQNQRAINLQFKKMLQTNSSVSLKKERHIFATYFVQVRHYYEIQYVKKEQIEESDQLFSLTNFLPKENANESIDLVKQAKSSIYKAHLTNLQQKTIVRNLVCLKYIDIYRYGEEGGNGFDWGQFQVYEKRDGVLAALYFIGTGWVVSSKQTPDGREVIYDSVTFREQFVRIFDLLDYKLPERRDECRVFLFQLLSTKISNVIPKQKDELILHGVRNMQTLVEQNHLQFKHLYFCAQRIDRSKRSIDEIVSSVEQSKDTQGVVLRDGKFNRIIVQSLSFLKKKWEKELEGLLSKSADFFEDPSIQRNRKLYFIYSQIILKNREKEYVQAFPSDSRTLDIILRYIKEANEQCQQIRKATHQLNQKSAKMNELIADKRIDVLNYLFSSCNKAFPQKYTKRNHASVSFIHSFNYIVQEIAYLKLKGQL